ncbi:hypothetical protein [Polaromonas sp.]|uniref:hypothetical protein n=1 Tax=Polaromonas sp. TaxID=1869339 RepID=UPI003265EB54
MAKRGFDASQDHDDAVPEPSRKTTYFCSAQQCRLPGTIRGVCNHHWVGATYDWPRITQVLNDMAPLIAEINRARATLCSEASNQREAVSGHVQGQARIEQYLSADQLAYMTVKPAKTYETWVYRLEVLVTAAVQMVMKTRRTPADVNHPAYRDRVRAAQIPGQAADFINEGGLSV